MTDTTAKIRAKGLDSTGVTDDIASEMYSRRGAYYMAIVELRVDETHDKADGTHKVDLVITQVEPATDPQLDDHLRNLTRTLHQNRALTADDAQLAIDSSDDLEPKVADVIAAGRHHEAPTDAEPHADDDQPYEEADDSDPADDTPWQPRVASPFNLPDPAA